MKLKVEIKKEVKSILVGKGIRGDDISLILNSLVNYCYSRIKRAEEIPKFQQQMASVRRVNCARIDEIFCAEMVER